MKNIGNLLDNVSKSSAVVERDINTILSDISLNTTDPIITIQINFVKWLGLQNKLNDKDVVTIAARRSEAKEQEQKEIEKRIAEGWEVSLRTETTQGISFNNKQELVSLKKHLRNRSMSNKDKMTSLNDKMNDFISSFNTFAKNVELLKVAYINKLVIYPMSYLNKVLTTDYFEQTNLPTLSEVERALRYIDGSKSQALWEINSAVEDTTDYDDEL